MLADQRQIGGPATVLDVAGQEMLETQLRNSRSFELSRDLTITCGFDGYFKSVNAALKEILGWSTEEFLARPFIEMVHPHLSSRAWTSSSPRTRTASPIPPSMLLFAGRTSWPSATTGRR
jgi:PAS domain-containing protein